MSKQYYISDIIGDGLTPETAFRPAIADHVSTFAAPLPTDVNGKPLKAWTLAIVASKNHAALKDINGVEQLPDFPADGKINAINQEVLNEVNSILSGRGISNTTNSSDAYRSLIREIGQQLDVNFDEDNFDISDV